jgi:hypothetical protein
VVLLLGIALMVEDAVVVAGVAGKDPVPVAPNGDSLEVRFASGKDVKLTGLTAGVDSRVDVGGPKEAEVIVDAVLLVVLETEGENGGRLNGTGEVDTPVEVGAGPDDSVAIGGILVSMELDIELAVPAADADEVVELNKGNGAVLGNGEDIIVVSDNPPPVDRGPTVGDADVLPVIPGVGLVTLPEEDGVGTIGGTVPMGAEVVLEFAAG